MLAYKLFRDRRDNTLGPLFINRKQVIELGKWLGAQFFPTKGFKPRAGWHCTLKPVAPHLTTKGRRWYRVLIDGTETYQRPESQGGTWVLAKRMMVLEEA